MSVVIDQAVRDEVLDVERSFIVQAPAGSGKTSLLVHRVLALLAVADRPEEVLAITFTRKAAAEMRERILKALRDAGGPEPEEDYERQAWRLARKAIARDEEMGWDILSYPLRLSIQTIDSLCTSLVSQMPWSSRTGGVPDVATNPERLYRAAAQATLAHLSESDSPWHDAVRTLLEQQDNNSSRVAGLLANMLQKRDQWLRHAGREDLDAARSSLESAWEGVIRHGLDRVAKTIPAGCAADIASVSAAAAENLAAGGGESPIRACRDLAAPPGTEPEDLAAWQGIRELFLVKGKAGVRKKVDKRQGMPAGSDEKEKMMTLLQRLTEEPDWVENLDIVAGLPTPRFEDSQWQGLLALVQALKLAVAELQIQFRDVAKIDFSEVALRAGEALGGLASPSDLALRLDYRLRHILVDEFQDTSHAQGNLLEHLVTGWEPGDGRTLFIVGDPMQSIYRFREADVGLFLRVRDRGVGVVRPEYRVLKCNFRSGQGVVDWYNTVFNKVFPRSDDMHSGAVTYSPAVAASPRDGASGVGVHGLMSPQQEADQVVDLVVAAKKNLEEAGTLQADKGKIAILVRGKVHLLRILPALRNAGLEYQAVELESLASRQAVLDILTLAQAILRLDHRPAWLALLRAPWCGLTLADLKALVGTNYGVPIWYRILDDRACTTLSAGGRERLMMVRTVLEEVMKNRHRVPITENVEWAWRQLGGPDCLAGSSLDDVMTCFAFLAQNEQGGSLENLDDLEELLTRLFAAPNGHDDRVQIMTIHKAKGLEFDTVILPGLDRQPGSDDRSALMWAEVAGDGPAGQRAEHELLLAPLPEAGSEATAQYEFLRDLEKKRNGYEQSRLLYVACTRAKRNLHLLGVLKEDKDAEVRPPHVHSLLNRLWPAIGEEFLQSYQETRTSREVVAGQEELEVQKPAAISRLPAGYSTPSNKPIEWTATILPAPPSGRPEFIWAGDTARLVGVWVHERLSDDYMRRLNGPIDESFRQRSRRQLAVLGIERQDLDGAVDRACSAISNMQDDPRIDWMFAAGHQAARAELDLSHIVEGRIERVRLDRTFIDEAGTRWIIDFKTGQHQGADVEEFLDSEQERYRSQLEGYADAVSAMEDRPIRLGLYFPLHCGWREWDYKTDGESNVET